MTTLKQLLLIGSLLLGMQSGLHADNTQSEQDTTEVKELTRKETLQSITLFVGLVIMIAMAKHDDQ